MNRKLIVPGGILWIAGLVLSIVGMNIRTDTGKSMAIVGNILFLIGLGITGAAWMMARRSEEQARQEKEKEA